MLSAGQAHTPMAMDALQVVASPLTAIVGFIFGCVKAELGHLYHHARNAGKLDESVSDLTRKRDGCQREVERAEAGMEEIKEEVTDWLEAARRRIEEHHQRPRPRPAGPRCCCIVHFVKWSGSRRAVAGVGEVDKLLERGNFATVSAGFRPPPDVEEMRCADYVADLPCVEATIGAVMDALQDDGIRSIGIYGLPGVGKTALVQAVNNRLRVEGVLFSKVIVTTVRSDVADMRVMANANHRRVQDEIAERLGLKLGSVGTSIDGKSEYSEEEDGERAKGVVGAG